MESMESARKDVEAMLEQGARFEHIEAYIEGRRDLHPDAQSALWLFAWCETDSGQRRNVVRELLTGLSQCNYGLPSSLQSLDGLSPSSSASHS